MGYLYNTYNTYAYIYMHNISQGLPRWLSGTESACNAGDTGLIPGLGRFPGEGNGNHLQYSCLGNPMDRRSLVGYCPKGGKEMDTTEHARP